MGEHQHATQDSECAKQEAESPGPPGFGPGGENSLGEPPCDNECADEEPHRYAGDEGSPHGQNPQDDHADAEDDE